MVLTPICLDVPLSNSQDDIMEKHTTVPEGLRKPGCTAKPNWESCCLFPSWKIQFRPSGPATSTTYFRNGHAFMYCQWSYKKLFTNAWLKCLAILDAPQTGRPFIFNDINLLNMIFLDLNIELHKKMWSLKATVLWTHELLNSYERIDIYFVSQCMLVFEALLANIWHSLSF